MSIQLIIKLRLPRYERTEPVIYSTRRDPQCDTFQTGFLAGYLNSLANLIFSSDANDTFLRVKKKSRG